jgi:hypothetical protein
VLPQVLTGRTMVLLVGGLVVGFLIGQSNWKSIEAFYDPKGAIFRGALTLFLLEMGIRPGPGSPTSSGWGRSCSPSPSWCRCSTAHSAPGWAPSPRRPRETLVTAELAERILALVAAEYFPRYAVIAFAQTVEVVRGDKYA